MSYLSVAEVAKKWGISERSVRNYCAEGRIDGAFLTGKTWNVPDTAEKPLRKNSSEKAPETLLDILKDEKKSARKGGIYHKIQVDLTYNSNHIEGSRLSHEQTQYIFETNIIGFANETVNVNDIVETVNHFKCIDLIIERADAKLDEKFIKQLHLILKSSTADSRKEWFRVGDYKKFPNEVGNLATTAPEDVQKEISALLEIYNRIDNVTLDDILDFHYKFECIHPFQDGNGRVGRLIMFKECLRHNIVPFIIYDDMKMFYYRGLREWKSEKGFLRDTCLSAQDRFKQYLDYFRIKYE